MRNKGFLYCEDCINNGNDLGDCNACDNGSNYEGADTYEELTVHELKFRINNFDPGEDE